MEILERIEKIIIHHSQRELDFPLFIKARHKLLRHWDDIGYHYLIGNGNFFTIDGKLYSGRQENLVGYHALGYNDNSLGICLIGNYDKTAPTQKQLLTLTSFLREKMSQYDISVQNIFGHRELPNIKKSCPGKFIDMDYIRSLVSKK